jgi:macrolide transport system ATP-binding/permease protein
MRWLARFRKIFQSLFRRQKIEGDLDAELQYHLEQEIESGIQGGLSPEDAKLAAQRLVGSVPLYKEECRDAWGIGVVENLMRDLRHAARMLRRTPLFTVVAIIMLALGIGANTTVFTFVENILLRSLPVRDPQQLAVLNWGEMLNLSYPNYVDFRDRNKVFSSLAAYCFNAANMSVQARENFRVWGFEASGNYFETLGVKPLLGRFLGPAEDDKPGGNPVVVISHRYWTNRFAADPDVVGRVVKMNGYPFTIIGVEPPSFSGTELILAGDYWVPLSMESQLDPGNDWLRSRGSQQVWTMGRLKPGISAAQAQANLDQIAQQLARTYPDILGPGTRFHLMRPGLIGQGLRGPITWLSAPADSSYCVSS